MEAIRLTLSKDLPISEVAELLEEISEIYQLLNLAYSAHTPVQKVRSTALIDDRQRIWLKEQQDLLLIGVSSGSIILDIGERLVNTEAFKSLFSWLKRIVDPYYQERTENELEDAQLDLELKKRDLLERDLALQEYELLNDIEVALKGISLVNEALKMHDGIVKRGFDSEVADEAFFRAVKCLSKMKQIQNRNNALTGVEIIEIEDLD